MLIKQGLAQTHHHELCRYVDEKTETVIHILVELLDVRIDLLSNSPEFEVSKVLRLRNDLGVVVSPDLLEIGDALGFLFVSPLERGLLDGACASWRDSCH